MWKNCGERRTVERHVENSALHRAAGPVWVSWKCRISGNTCPQGIPTFYLILLSLSKGIIAPVQWWWKKRGKLTPCLPAHMLLIPEKPFIGLTNLCNSWLTHHFHCLCIQENVTAWIFFLCFFFLFMIQRGNKYERDLLAVRPQPEDGALVQPCQVFLPCSSWHFRLNHDLVEFRGENLSLEGRTSWEAERLEGEVMHHCGTVYVIWDKLWEKCLKAAQLRGMMGSGWIFCPEGLCYMAGTGPVCAKDPSIEKREVGQYGSENSADREETAQT